MLLRQVCDLWEPQGQLGARSHRPQQRHSSDARDHQSPGEDGEGRLGLMTSTRQQLNQM